MSPALFLLYSTAAMAESLSLNQCANGGISDNVNHLECHEGWINGNLNASKAAYAEGDFVPYRVQLTGLTPGEQYTYSFSWDILKSGKHALDYIGSYNYSVTAANACTGAAGPCPGTTTTINIPPDNDPVEGALNFVPIPGHFTLFGGTLNSVGPYISPSSDVRAISVTFTPNQANAVLAWGGHISSPADWGNGTTASDIKGSPYHMSNISLDDSTGESVAGGGQDVQLSAAAVFVPSLINVTKISNADGTFAFESDIDGMTLLPIGEAGPTTWYLDRDESKTIDAMKSGEVTITETGLPAGDWRIKSISCSKLGVGEVFSYVYPDDTATDSAVLNVDEAGTFNCVFENEFYGAPVLEVIKKVVGPDDDCTPAVRDDIAGNETISVHSGEEVRYCIWVTNTGADKALDVILVDDLAGLGSEIEIPLTGGSLPDEGSADPVLPDLPVDGWLSATMTMTMDVPLNTTLLNTATATAIGKTDGKTYMDDDTAEVKVDQASNCTLGGSVYAGTGSCPGSSTAHILKDSVTPANWCANVFWDAAAVLDLTDIVVTLDGMGVSNDTAPDMNHGSSQNIEVGFTTPGFTDPKNDVTGTLILTGSEGGLNTITCSGTATVNVVDPGLELIKLASTNATCGDADDADTVEIYSGDEVWYCLTVSNTGDVPLEDVLIDDQTLGLVDYAHPDLEDLGVGVSTTIRLGPESPTQDVTNIAYATATEPLTGTETEPEMGSATVIVLSADIEVNKSVDPDHIVFCQLNDWKDFCTDQNAGGNYDTIYTISVKNNGPSLATAVTLDDDLPFGFIYDSNDGGCLYEASSHSLSCSLGDIAAGATIEVQVTGEIDVTMFDPPWQRLTNQACANTDPVRLDPIRSNNCDNASTQISTGPTRTIGWWSTHPNGLAACVAASSGEIDLGFLTIMTETFDNEIDATVSTNPGAKGKHKSSLVTPKLLKDLDSDATVAEEMAKGMLNARTARWRDGTKRSHIGQARVNTAKQLTAAWCNEVTFGSEFDFYYLGWNNIRLIMNGEAYLQGGGVKTCDGLPCTGHLNQVIQSIKLIGGVADLFNNAGDDLDNGLPSERAYPKAPQDDPTDPTD
ncbi:DUF11 domain-containing protein [Pseudomonadota bacterium]